MIVGRVHSRVNELDRVAVLQKTNSLSRAVPGRNRVWRAKSPLSDAVSLRHTSEKIPHHPSERATPQGQQTSLVQSTLRYDQIREDLRRWMP